MQVVTRVSPTQDIWNRVDPSFYRTCEDESFSYFGQMLVGTTIQVDQIENYGLKVVNDTELRLYDVHYGNTRPKLVMKMKNLDVSGTIYFYYYSNIPHFNVQAPISFEDIEITDGPWAMVTSDNKKSLVTITVNSGSFILSDMKQAKSTCDLQ